MLWARQEPVWCPETRGTASFFTMRPERTMARDHGLTRLKLMAVGLLLLAAVVWVWALSDALRTRNALSITLALALPIAFVVGALRQRRRLSKHRALKREQAP